jgi:hypothetical protein
MTKPQPTDVTTQTGNPAAGTGADSADSAGTTDAGSVLSNHKGKLAIGVAATLGLLIFYNLRQKKLPEEDPEGFARLQRIKESVKAAGSAEKRQHVPAASDKGPPNKTDRPEPV